jgi:hypothetical protein
MQILKNPAVKIGVTAVIAYALVAFVQTKIKPIPVVGQFLPR